MIAGHGRVLLGVGFFIVGPGAMDSVFMGSKDWLAALLWQVAGVL